MDSSLQYSDQQGECCLWPHSVIYSVYSAHAVMMQYGNADIMLDIIRGIDAIRTGHVHFHRDSTKVDVSVF